MSRLPFAARFWLRVDRSSWDGCWPWAGKSRNRYNYGTTPVPGGGNELTHRLAWMFTNGPIPKRLAVCHTCDNRPCCNPTHFFLGSQADNIRDMVSKGRLSHGARHPLSKLTPRTIGYAAFLTGLGLSLHRVSQLMGVKYGSLWRAVSGHTWNHEPIAAFLPDVAPEIAEALR